MILLEVSYNLNYSGSLYTLKVSDVCFNFSLFQDFDYVIFLSQILIYQVFLIRNISLSFLQFFMCFLKPFINVFIWYYFIS